MLKKLYKHEFHSLFRTLWPAYVGLIALAIVSRISFLFETHDAAILSNKTLVFTISTIKGALTTFYVMGILAVFVISLTMIVIRFYRHLLSSQGYLSFTLPVTPTDHILCKLVCGTVMMILSAIGVIISLLILSIGYDFSPLMFKDIANLWNELCANSSLFNVIVLVVSLLSAGILSIISLFMQIYTSIAIGQMFRNRIVAAVLIYIGMSMALQFVTVIIALPVIFYNIIGMADMATIEQGIGFVTTGIVIFNFASLAVNAVFFLITRHIFTNKLNLE